MPQKQIIISELLPNPQGKDKGREWIELENKSDKTINLNNWKLKNNKNHTLQGEISPQSLLIIDSLKITLRNKTDTITLLNPDGQEIDFVIYKNAKNGQSLSRIGSMWQWTTPSKNLPNPKIEKIIIKSSQLPDEYLNTKNQELGNVIIKQDLPTEVLIEKSTEGLKIMDIEIINPEKIQNPNMTDNWLYPLMTIAILLGVIIKAILSKSWTGK